MTIDPKIQGAQPERREKNRQRGTADVLVPFMSLTSAGMLGFAVPNLISGSGATFYGKCILITAGAAIVSWGVNTLAIKRGAPLFSKGYLIAGLTSVSTVALVGAGLWSATYSGLVASDVEQMHLDSHAQQMGDHVARERTRTQKLFEVGVVVIAIRDGFAQKFACEVASACVSGRGSGEGPTSREIANQHAAASTLSAKIDEAAITFTNIDAKVADALANYQALINSDDTNVVQRRAALQRSRLELDKALSAAGSVLPAGLLRSYADELAKGVVIPGKLEASDRLTKMMRGQAEALDTVLDEVPGNAGATPALPPKTGVSDTFDYIGHFMPVAAVTAVIEMVLPLALWIYTALFLDWAIYQKERPQPVRRSEDDEVFDDWVGSPKLRAQSAASEPSRARLNGKSAPAETDQPHVGHWPNR